MLISSDALNIVSALGYAEATPEALMKTYRSGMGAADVSRLIAPLGDPAAFRGFRTRVAHYLESKHAADDMAICFCDSQYPAPRHLGVSQSKWPAVLFCRGNISLLRSPTVAVIGTRRTTPELEKREAEMVRAIAGRGLTIMSGLAMGCDTVAHRAALEAGGRTIAALPSPLYDVTPAQNRPLADEIVMRGGLLISEYWTTLPREDSDGQREAPPQKTLPASRAQTKRFVERDRLQAYYADCVLLAASREKNRYGGACGSRHALEAARLAKIPRAVMYGAATDLNDPLFGLNRTIIAQDGPLCRIVGAQNAAVFAERIVAEHNGGEQSLNF